MSHEKHQIIVLDGGMGTTLENSGVDVSSSLWGSDLLLSNPEPIAKVHRNYVESGAHLIESATYPLCTTSILREYPTKTRQEADGVLHRGLALSLESAQGRAGVVLALGPYGATTKPGAEYSGLYAPPFGNGTVLGSAPSTSFASAQEEQAAEDALYRFHLDRLRTYEKADRWAEVEWIGFETIPLIREIRAIRRAMLEIKGGKKFWIAATFPEGQSPQSKPDGSRYTVADVVRSLVGVEGGAGAQPDGVGINCTNPAYLSSLVNDFNETIRSMDDAPGPTSRPWFVMYPDGGQVYDPITRTWSREKLTPVEWATRMIDIVKQIKESGEWRGTIIGGCCKTSPEEIKELRALVDQLDQE